MKKVTVDEVNTTVVAEAVEEVKEAPAKKTRAKKAADTESAEKKAPAKKRAAKKAAEAETAETAEAPKKTAAKKTTTRKAKAVEVQAAVSVQFSGKEYTTGKLVEIAKDVWQYDLGQAPEEFKTVELYVKTEESVVFYVINGETTGSFAI